MNEYELIDTARGGLNHAERSMNEQNHQAYAEHMQTVLDLLIEELVGSPPAALTTPVKTFSPEQILTEIALAIKYRTISSTGRWHIVYYYTRFTCVPTNINVPEQIILHEFTAKMAEDGFTTIYWNQLKQNVIELHKELEL